MSFHFEYAGQKGHLGILKRNGDQFVIPKRNYNIQFNSFLIIKTLFTVISP